MHTEEEMSSSITKLYVRKDKAAVRLLSYGKLGNKSKRKSSDWSLGIAQETISSIPSQCFISRWGKYSKELC